MGKRRINTLRYERRKKGLENMGRNEWKLKLWIAQTKVKAEVSLGAQIQVWGLYEKKFLSYSLYFSCLPLLSMFSCFFLVSFSLSKDPSYWSVLSVFFSTKNRFFCRRLKRLQIIYFVVLPLFLVLSHCVLSHSSQINDEKQLSAAASLQNNLKWQNNQVRNTSVLMAFN